MEIKPLSENVITKIHSFCCINNITHCVTELVLNSLDAKSSAIAIRINPSYFRIQIVDNGIGISQENMENIALKNFTSKCSSLNDLDLKTKTHGYKGESLWNISHLSKNVNITSKSSDSDQTFSKNILNGKRSKVILAKNRQSNGTTVTVDGIFNNLPVRQKIMKKEYELEEIVSVLKSLSLIYPQVSFSLRNDATGKLILKCQKHNNVIQSLISLYPDIKENELIVMKVSKDKIKIDTLFLKEITYCQIIQQIFLNRRPVVFPDLRKLLFQQLQKSGKKNISNATLHPMFIINVKCPISHYNLTYEDSSPVVEFKNVDVLERCVEKMISSFLGKPLKNNDTLKEENKIKSVCGVSDLQGAIKGCGFKNWLREGEMQSHTKENDIQLFQIEQLKDNYLHQSDECRYTEDCRKTKRQKFKKSKPLPIKMCEFKNKRISMNNEVGEINYNTSKSENKMLTIVQNNLHDKYLLHSSLSRPLKRASTNGTFIQNYQNLEEKLQKLIFKKDMNSTLFSNFTNSENKGKDVLMYMFLKSTELFPNNIYNEQSVQPSEQSVYDTFNNSNETIMESNIFFKNTRKTKTLKMNKTVSISVKLKRRRNKSPEERINIESNATYTCSKPKKRNIEERNETSIYMNLKKNDKATSPLFALRKRNYESIEYAAKQRADKNIQTTFFEERDEVKPRTFAEIPQKKIKFHDAYKKNFDNSLYKLENNKIKTIIEAESNAVFEDDFHISNSIHFKFPNEFDERKSVSHFGRYEFQRYPSTSFLSNNVELIENENNLLFDWNKSRIFSFKESYNNSRQLRYNQKFSTGHNYKPFMFELKKLTDNSSKALNNSFRHYTDKCVNSVFKVDDITLGKSFNFENLSVSPIPKLIPMPNQTEISEQILLADENFHIAQSYANVLPFKKCSTDDDIIYRNDGYAKIKDHSNFKKRHTEPIINSRSLYIENVKRNLDKLFLESKSVIAQKSESDHKSELNEQIYSKDSLENISRYTSDERVSLWKTFIKGKRKQKNNSDEASRYEALANSINTSNRFKQTAPVEPINLSSKSKSTTPFSPDLFSMRIRNSKVDSTFQPNSQPSFEIGKNSWEIEEDILLINRTITAKENCQRTLTVTCGNSPRDSAKQLEEEDGLGVEKNDSIPANQLNWEWIEKLDQQGNKFYFNIRTGMTSFVCPKHDAGFNFRPRFEFMPKGLSPVLMQDDKVCKTISPNCREKLHDEILKSYENELDIVKWEKYFKENDPRQFFDELYKEKRNDYETEVPDVYQSNISRSMTITGEYKYSKTLFDDLEVIGQLDQKFIAAVDRKHSNLIMFDQHAIHERIRVESLAKEYDGANIPCENITLFIIQCDIKLLKHHEKYLNTIGIHFKTFKNGLTVYKVPLCLYHKVKKEPKQSSCHLAKLVELLIQEILQQIKMTRGILTGLPKIIHEIINLEACRGAIKFGDYLSEYEMKEHIKNLSQCVLPFQCAHGRPTLVPILNLAKIPQVQLKKLQFKKLNKSLFKLNTVRDDHNSLHKLDEPRSRYFEI